MGSRFFARKESWPAPFFCSVEMKVGGDRVLVEIKVGGGRTDSWPASSSSSYSPM